MPVQLNNAGARHAASLIRQGKVNRASSWSWSDAADGDALLGDDNWTEYARWHLGRNTEAAEDTKAGWRYPFGKGGKVYRSALIAIRQRAGQQKATAIGDEAGKLLEKIDNRMEELESERRYLAPAEVRESDDGRPVLTGFIPFDEETIIGGLFREVIRPGFFSRAIRERQDTIARYNHLNSLPPLGRVSSETLRLTEDANGLRYENAPPDTEAARGIVEGIRRGDIPFSSFSFKARSIKDGGQRWTENPGDEMPLRELLDIERLVDVSPVDSGAYKGSVADVRSAAMIHEDYLGWKGEQEPPDDGSERSEPRLEIERRLLQVSTEQLRLIERG